jgi:hypothetical protein
MAREAAQPGKESFTGKLAKYFPDATPVRIPVEVSANGSARRISEHTVIEFGTPREVLFSTNLPLEFADKIRLRNSDGSLDVDAWVVAVQCQEGRVAVAARFAKDVINWIVKS